MGVNRKAAASAGKPAPVPGSSADMRNKLWDDLQEWGALDSARSAAGGELPAATIADDLVPALGLPSRDVDRLVSAATTFDVVSGWSPPDPAALARAADDLRYAVRDARTAPELQPPPTAEKLRLIARTAQVGDKLLLTAADALRRAQRRPGDAADPLTSGIRDLLAQLSTRPAPFTGELRRAWDSSDFLQEYMYTPPGETNAVSVGNELGQLDRYFREWGIRDNTRAQAARVMPMLLDARNRVMVGNAIPGQERARLLAEIDNVAMVVEGLLGR
jgi:hypothetical protein